MRAKVPRTITVLLTVEVNGLTSREARNTVLKLVQEFAQQNDTNKEEVLRVKVIGTANLSFDPFSVEDSVEED